MKKSFEVYDNNGEPILSFDSKGFNPGRDFYD